ncbi:MAG: hypothetical protein NTX22_00610 [Ignavibacteriales bacterium]|nr:hypothetical protein [Ignavibacteriales bacterium]
MRENLLAAGKRESNNIYNCNRFPLPPTAGRLAYCRQVRGNDNWAILAF